MKLNNLLLERLLRDLRKRCNLHIRLLSGANAEAELYEKRASLLLDKIAKLERKVPELNVVVTADVERHWIEGEVHALEMEFYQQKDSKACKGLWDKLREEETRLKPFVAIEKKKASSDSVPPAEGMRVPPIGFPVDIGASLPLATVDPDFIVLGFCALVLIGGTLYFWFKDDGRDDDGDSGSGGRVNKGGIASVSGLKELVPSTPDDFGVRDVNYFDFYGLLINLYYGESVVGHESVVCGEMRRETVTEMQPIWCNTTKSVVGESGVGVGESGVGQPPVSICSFLRCAFLFVRAMVLCFCCLSTGKTSTLNKVKVNARPYILLALSYVTLTPLVDVSEIIARITKTFECKSVIVSKMGNQYNVGIWNLTASRYTAVRLLRSVFPEFEDCQVNVSFHKGWNNICRSIMKKDKTPVVWGEEPLFLVKNRAKAVESKTRGPDLANLLRTKNSWEEVLADDRLVNKCLSSYNSVRSTFEDLQDVKSKNSMSFFCKLWLFVKEQGGPFYSARDLRECNTVLYWLVLNLCRPRHLRQKQLLILGLPGTQKTLFVHCLSQFIDIYFVPRRPNDFTGGNKHSNVWVIDEFNGYETDASLLNMILDGQKVALDVKYGKIFTKDHNVPIMLLGNHIPSMYNSEAFQSRVITVHFFSEKEPLKAGRLASTLLRYCIWYGTCSKADGEGLKALGYHLLTESNLSQLSERAGFRLHSMEVLKKVYDRLSTVSRSRYLKWFERFDSVAKARLYLPRDEAEYAKKVAPGNLEIEVELSELALQVEREMEGKGPEQERRTLSLEELDPEQQEQVCEERNLSDSEDVSDPEDVLKRDDGWIKTAMIIEQEKRERMGRGNIFFQKAKKPIVYYEGSDWEDYRK